MDERTKTETKYQKNEYLCIQVFAYLLFSGKTVQFSVAIYMLPNLLHCCYRKRCTLVTQNAALLLTENAALAVTVNKTGGLRILSKTHHEKLIVAGQIFGTIISFISGDACAKVSTRYKRHKLSKYDFPVYICERINWSAQSYDSSRAH